MLELADVTERIIGAAIEVHRQLGPGFLEIIYERALVIELEKRRIRYQSQHVVPICYDAIQIGEHRLDLLVEGQIVVELKAVKDVEEAHFAVVRSYLRATGLKHGLILNFSTPTLWIKRVIA